MRPQFLRIGLRKREVSLDVSLRWDKSPWTCEQILKRLPLEEQAWHAQWANNEITPWSKLVLKISEKSGDACTPPPVI
ncbi:DUF3830 family protein [Mesorhizobium sp. M1322]|uniref:DUF3830 family protein n=1 Tax=Mesorhizobium sp. M1322 TaxID=2957081 RepID=UPI003335C881